MASLPFDTSGSDDEVAWELYHENAKRGRKLGVRQVPRRDDDRAQQDPPSLETIALDGGAALSVAFDPAPGAGAGDAPPTARDALSAILPSALTLAAPLSIAVYLAVGEIDGVPPGLYRYDGATRALILERRGDMRMELAGAVDGMASPALATRAVMLVGKLDDAAYQAGERGYRDVLMAAGRVALALELACKAGGRACRALPVFYDREVDALLGLDGLGESVLAVMAID